MSCASLTLVIALAGVTSGSAGHGHSFAPGSETSGLSKMVREIYGGSKLREFAHMFMDPLPERVIGTAAGHVNTLADGTLEQTFISPPMTLLNGHIVNKWLPIDWPQGHIAVKAFSAEVAKAGPNGEIPPTETCCGGPLTATRKEVFMHHWTVNKWELPVSLFTEIVNAGGLDYSLTLREKTGYIEFLAGAGLNSGANGPCWDSNLHLYFGIGNEVRTLTKDGKFAYVFPEPYGVEFNSVEMRQKGEFMVLNTHLIDIRNVSDKRACSECKCSELGSKGFLNITEGGLSCCHSTFYDGGKCPPAKPDVPSTNATYYIRYTIKWKDFNPATTLPLEVVTFDATDNNTKWGDLPFIPGGFKESHSVQKADETSMAIVNDGRSGDFDGKRACHIEWFVPPCKAGDSCIMKIKNSWELPYPMHIVFVRNHFHAGGISMTTWANGFNCTGQGTYDANQNLVDISICSVPDSDNVHVLNRGDLLNVEAVYEQDDLPHYGVMSMSFVYVHVPKQQLDVHV